MNTKKGPWTITSTKQIYKNPWMEVVEDQVLQPDGNPGIFGYIEIKAGVTVLALDEKQNVFLTREFHYAVATETLEAVSGGMDKGEDILETAKRELQEETGITAKKWTDLGVIDPFTSQVVSPNYLYLAQDLEFTRHEREGTETMKVLKVPFTDAFKMAMESKITHGASVAVILKAKEYLAL